MSFKQFSRLKASTSSRKFNNFRRKRPGLAYRTLSLTDGTPILRIKARRSGDFVGALGNRVHTAWFLQTGNQRILVRFYYPNGTILFTSILSYFPAGSPATNETDLSWVKESFANTSAGAHFFVVAVGTPGADTSWSDSNYTYGSGGLLVRGR